MQERAISHALINEASVPHIDTESQFTLIFQKYYKRIYNYINYRVNCHFTSEDLTSQVFEKTMNKIDTYSPDKSPFEVWLFAIARNVVNDYFRSQQRRRFFSLDGFKELVSGRKGPESLAIQGEVNDRLQQALETLSARERNLIALKFGAELKNTEISELLDITVDNVGIILYRTLKKLRKTLGSVEFE
ncbi:sigma-70 family RNA polymerase sigma factor [Paenibacillus donghaensis]|uniref:sigma-70 family RNA polymerase sigma factor n=1 Tax=Paenibacillus donghaensis TaxID=414771 RepID=UPI0018836CEB|nr:sigma-70 family RNA polymerase sigma factor [Paenibacillus donghaensis]MBE9916879.1 sigma-70 family RNA polymerase sigma factor [Paenibacillus donghaensis]